MLKIHLNFDPILYEVAQPVAEITPRVRAALSEMVTLMNTRNGIGLAAPQVGISQQFLVMKDLKNYWSDVVTAPVLKMINPNITAWSAKTTKMREKCLSVRGSHGGISARVMRPKTVTVEWTDEKGVSHSREFTGLAARIVQHEISHLNGKLFIDYLSASKRETIIRKMESMK